MRHYYTGAFTVLPSDTVYFVTITVIDWIDVFTRDDYKRIIAESLVFCRNKKGLQIFAWVLMTNHIHLIVAHDIDSGHLCRVIGDFKKFTSKKIIKAIKDSPIESRKRWMLDHFFEENIRANNDASCSFSKRGIAIRDLDNSAYDCGSCHDYPDGCDVCRKEMKNNCQQLIAGESVHYHLWQRGFDKYCISNIKHLRQKMDYIHNNPVRAGLVCKPWEYRYSSARNYSGDTGEIEIDFIDMGLSDPTKQFSF